MLLGLHKAVPDPALDKILEGVSRSFYLSLAILPTEIRTHFSVAYLIARAADTIADTQVVRRTRRLELLASLRDAVAHADQREAFAKSVADELSGHTKVAAERVLLENLHACLDYLGRFELGDRDRIQVVLGTLITGMERDLTRFDPEGPLASIDTWQELDDHTYFAAGCVGEFWSLMAAAHIPSLARLARPDLRARGTRLGKALQLVNVLRDAPNDLAEGRCYIPREALTELELEPADLRDEKLRLRAKPVLDRMRQMALDHSDAAWTYVLAIPRTEVRMRLAAIWPLWIGLATLEQYAAAPDPLDPAMHIKITRNQVYRIVAESTAIAPSDALLERGYRARRALA